MTREVFEICIAPHLAPTLPPGDVIILPSHRLLCKRLPGNGHPVIPQKPEGRRRHEGRWRMVFLFLPPCSPDPCGAENSPPGLFSLRSSPIERPIEMAFAKLKALIRRAAARPYDALWQAVGHVCDLFTEEECHNLFKAAG